MPYAAAMMEITPLKIDSVAIMDPNALMTLRCMFSLPSTPPLIPFSLRNFLAILRALPQSQQ